MAKKICTCGTGIDDACDAHEDAHKDKATKKLRDFPSLFEVALIAFIVLVIAYGLVWGSCDPSLYPGDFGY
jgi:hypothetical protein